MTPRHDRRIKKSVDADGPGSGAAVVSRYVYDGDHIALVFDGSNNLKNRYLHGPVVDQILADEQIGGTLLWHQPLPSPCQDKVGRCGKSRSRLPERTPSIKSVLQV